MVQMRGSFLENAKECLRTVSMLFSLFAHNFLYPLHTIFKTLATYSMPTSSCNIKKSDISVCGKVQRDVFVNTKKKNPNVFRVILESACLCFCLSVPLCTKYW